MLQTKISREEIKEIARKISTQSQLPKQYFDLGTILLVNVSFHNDPDHFWEYEVFKLDNKGNAYSFESVTVNMRNDEGEWLFSWLLNWERETFNEMRHPISGKPLYENEYVPANQVQQFKREFDQLKYFI